MTTVIKLSAMDLPNALMKEAERGPKLIEKAARAAALRLKAYLVSQSDDLGITDLGTYKRSFVADKNSVTNHAPHAPIVEEGCRPHFISEKVRKKLVGWAMRKLGLSPEEAERASWGIKHGIEANGIQGRYPMRDALPQAKQFFEEELIRLMRDRHE